MAGEGRDGAAVSLLGYRVGGGRDSHTKLGIKTRWSATVGRRSRNLVLMLSVGLTIATLRSDNGDVHENVAER